MEWKSWARVEGDEDWLEWKGWKKKRTKKLKLSWRKKRWVDKWIYELVLEGCYYLWSDLSLSADSWRSLAQKVAAGWSTHRSQLPYAGQMLSKYRVCLKAGATVCLCLFPCVSLLCRANNRVDTLVRYSHYVAVFQTVVPLAFAETSLCFWPYYSLTPLYLPLSPSAVNFSLFLGLVVRWPSTHEQLEPDLWPWRDLSPLLSNHARRWRCVSDFFFSKVLWMCTLLLLRVICFVPLLCREVCRPLVYWMSFVMWNFLRKKSASLCAKQTSSSLTAFLYLLYHHELFCWCMDKMVMSLKFFD